MDIKATLIAPVATVAAARSAQSGAAFPCPLSASGELPATHYVSSGYIPQADLDALAGLCAITTGPHNAHEAIADAGLVIITEPLNA